MKLQTTRFGEIDVNEEELLTVEEGLVGFSELTRFVLLDHDAESPFKWLQSVDDGGIALIVVSPLTFKPDYLVEVTEEEIASLELSTPDDAIVSVVVTIPLDPKKMSANLKAPLIFNSSNRKGKQFILKDPNYQTKHYILEELKKYPTTDPSADLKKSIQNQFMNNGGGQGFEPAGQ